MRNPRALTRTLLALVLLVVPALAQQSIYYGQAFGVNPFSPGAGATPGPIFLPYAQVRVCTVPAVGTPCTPLASIWDLNGNPLSVPVGQFGQLTTNVVGQYNFQCNSGNIFMQIEASSSNTPQQTVEASCPSGIVSTVSSVFGRSGIVTAQSGDYNVGQVTGAAPLASPTFTGIPVIPTNTQPVSILQAGANTQCLVTIFNIPTWANCNGLATTGVTLVNPGQNKVTVGANTTSFQTAHTYTIPAGVMNGIGKTVHIVSYVIITPNSAPGLTVNYGFTFGIANYTVSYVAPSTVDQEVKLDAWCNTLATGASGGIRCLLGITLFDDNAGINLVKNVNPSPIGQTIDLTNTIVLNEIVSFSAGSLNNSMDSYTYQVYQDN